ncbi:hypothetical protein GQ457_02G013540 [Hibiscus cannabinus]
MKNNIKVKRNTRGGRQMVLNKLVAFIYSVVGVMKEATTAADGYVEEGAAIFSVGEEERFQFHTREAFTQDIC